MTNKDFNVTPEVFKVASAMKQTSTAERRLLTIFRKLTSDNPAATLRRSQIASILGRKKSRLNPHDVNSLEKIRALGLVQRNRSKKRGAIGFEYIYWMLPETASAIRSVTIKHRAEALQREMSS